MKFFQPRRTILELILILLLGFLVSLPSFDQTTIEMNEFNAAYFQYGDMKDTDSDVVDADFEEVTEEKESQNSYE